MGLPTTSLPQFIQSFLAHCHRRRFPSKAAIIRQGDPAGELYYIVSGSVTVLLEDDKGHEIVLSYLNAGEFFGEIGLFSEDASRSALVRARQECEVAQISYSKLKGLTELYPMLISAMTSQLARRLRNTNRKLGDLAFMDVYGRVARTLLDLCDQPDAMTHPAGMQVRVTRQELARLVGCSREMVGKVLKEMENHKQVDVAGKNIVLLGVRPRPLKRFATA
ncbi:MAG: cAMP-activated global transcriptional regulator CRP [Gammaproteobacteria bacterium]|nr:cAMP-activated global transcriptional regulator CRP [Gammaproteobacteria bacterium]MBI5616421.1 cAMP-activated global transcriptional regulator CRP [Gammaproteobacteria bacterium]